MTPVIRITSLNSGMLPLRLHHIRCKLHGHRESELCILAAMNDMPELHKLNEILLREGRQAIDSLEFKGVLA